LKRWPNVGSFAEAGGYDRNQPRLELTEDAPANDRSSIINERLRAIYYHPRRFRDLRGITRENDPRGERREAIVLVLMAWHAGLENFATGRVGYKVPESGHLMGIPVSSWKKGAPSLCAWTGLTSDRVERAITDISQAGWQSVERFVRPYRRRRGDQARPVTYLCSPQPREPLITKSGRKKHKGKPTIRNVRYSKLWRAVNLHIQAETWGRADAAAAAKAKAKAEEEARAADEEKQKRVLRNLPLFVGTDPNAPRGSQAPYLAGGYNDPATAAAKRQIQAEVEVSKEHPDWSLDERRAEARARLRETGPPPDSPDEPEAPF